MELPRVNKYTVDVLDVKQNMKPMLRDRTETPVLDAAIEAFRFYRYSTKYAGKTFHLILKRGKEQILYHRFDAEPGEKGYLQDCDIELAIFAEIK